MKIGILGAGQLAMMLAQAATDLQIETLCFSEQKNTPASHTSDIFYGNMNNTEDLAQFAEQVDVITLENEFISINVLKFLRSIKPIYPDENCLAITQDRLLEKKLFNQLNINCANFITVDNFSDAQCAAVKFNGKAILKTRTMGYDGKGQWRIHTPTPPELPNYSNMIMERLIDFDTECSMIATKNMAGDIKYYPLTENKHHDGILIQSTAPFEPSTVIQSQAQTATKSILNALNYIGTIAIEFFVTENELIANEIAPRVHNSGHWTIEGTQTSQFENHCRAICNIPLGKTELIAPCTMKNIIGTMPDFSNVNNQSNIFIHNYHKAPRPGRKLGHITQLL